MVRRKVVIGALSAFLVVAMGIYNWAWLDEISHLHHHHEYHHSHLHHGPHVFQIHDVHTPHHTGGGSIAALGESRAVEMPTTRPRHYFAMSYHIGKATDGLHLAVSDDGINFRKVDDGKGLLIPGSRMSPKPGNGILPVRRTSMLDEPIMRDPAISRAPDGRYHLVWMSSWRGTTIGYATSKDLIHWQKPRELDIMGSLKGKTRNVWSPEIFWLNNEEAMIVFAASVNEDTDPTHFHFYDHRIYYTTTKDFHGFQDAKLLFDPGYAAMEPHLMRWMDGSYVLFFKDDRVKPFQKNIRASTSRSPFGPWSEPGEPITDRHYWANGPTTVVVDGSAYLYFDKNKDDSFGGMMTQKLEKWTDISDRTEKGVPGDARHPTVIEISQSAYDTLRHFHSSPN
eukprot:jgi/Mesvir1/18194/Mv09480-RA.1